MDGVSSVTSRSPPNTTPALEATLTITPHPAGCHPGMGIHLFPPPACSAGAMQATTRLLLLLAIPFVVVATSPSS